MTKGTFIISLDFELFWGVRANRELEEYQDKLVKVYEVIPKMLALFKKYDIHVTWATVGFLFHKDIDEINKNRAKILPEYKDRQVDPYLYLESISSLSPYSKEFSKVHCASELISLIANEANQELATHTYSHFFTYEPIKNINAFDSDIQKAIEVAKERGYELKSLVFPRNQVSKDSIKSLKALGISSYRANPNHWAYRDGDKPSKPLFLRLYRLVDTYINLSGHHTTFPVLIDGMTELKASMMLRPYFSKLSYLEPLKISRIKKSMKYASENGKNFHLWWHPHNFGKNQDNNLKNLEEILLYFQELQKKNNMLSLTMDEVKEYVNK